MSETPIQLIVAAFSTTERAANAMNGLKEGEAAGTISLVDAAVVTKNVDGELEVTDSRTRSRKAAGFLTGGIVGGAIGLLAGPVGLAAVGGGVLGTLAGKLSGLPIEITMKDIGESLTPGSSAILAVVEHSWVDKVKAELAAQSATIAHESLKADIAQQLKSGGNVVYTAGVGAAAAGAGRLATNDSSIEAGGVVTDGESVSIKEAKITDETL
ncbi:MAG: DUF1269 domain-containing protein [Pyrinomonadaceae bacterium]|nr:DUF1269 domain-containing protein [Pyrinomonadaceae bacterium]